MVEDQGECLLTSCDLLHGVGAEKCVQPADDVLVRGILAQGLVWQNQIIVGEADLHRCAAQRGHDRDVAVVHGDPAEVTGVILFFEWPFKAKAYSVVSLADLRIANELHCFFPLGTRESDTGLACLY